MIFEKLKEIICEQLEVRENQVTLESNLVEDFDADSLDLVDIVMSIEDVFGIEVPEEDIEDVKIVGDIVKFIEDKMQ